MHLPEVSRHPLRAPLRVLFPLRIGNGVGKQGRGNHPPYRRYGRDTKIQYRHQSHTDLQNPAEFSRKGKPIRNFSINPTSSIRTSIADAVLADAISETPNFLLELQVLLPLIMLPLEVRADFWEGDEDSNFQFSKARGSLNRPDLTELPFL